jgi:DNA modification methylase
MGSGTVGRVCDKLGRDFVGYDLESILKKLYPNVDYSKIEKIVNRVYGK